MDIIMTPYNQITSQIYLGNINSSRDTTFLRQKNIKAIFNCSKTIPFANINIHKYRLPVNDDLKPISMLEFLRNLPIMTSKIHEHIKKGDTILIHCHAGMQRSAGLLAAYFMKYYHLPLMKSVELIQNKRNIAFRPSINFLPSLKIWEHLNHMD